MTVVRLATSQGLIEADEAGRIRNVEFEGREVVAVAVGDGVAAAALAEEGVWLGADGHWRCLGLEDAILWTVALSPGSEVYAGVEPAALWRVGDGAPQELSALSMVEGHDQWHSPWGPADLSAILVDDRRLIVGVEIGGVAVSYDRGATWEARNTGLFDDVHVVTAFDDMLCVSTGMGCFVTRDEGRQWVWASDGIDRGYTLGLTRSGGALVVGAASGPPTFWEAGGPEAAIYRAAVGSASLRWVEVCDAFVGAVERHCLEALGDVVVAGTTAGELLVSRDGGRRFAVARTDLAPVRAVAVSRD